MKRLPLSGLIVVLLAASIWFGQFGQSPSQAPAQTPAANSPSPAAEEALLPGARDVIDARRYASLQDALDALPSEGGLGNASRTD